MLKRIISNPLTYILIFAFFMRILFINYGLPLWVYNDEPPFVLGALKMIQLKSIFPVFHESEFTPFLYYPPYISYLYLPFFVITAGFSFLFFPGTFAQFQTSLASDPSIFFITGRLIMILLSLFVIYFIYKISRSIVNDRYTSLATAFLASTSIMSITLAVTGKQWMPILFFYTLGLFLLAKKDWSLKKRFLLAGIVTGIGTGVSTIIILFSVIMVFWYVLFENKKVKEVFTNILMYKIAFIIIILAIVPILLYPASLGFVPDMTLHDDKTLLGFITSPFIFTLPLILTEPILVILSVIGLCLGFKKYKSFFILEGSFIVIYSIVFYTCFRFEYRFLLPLTLLLCISSAFGIKEIKDKPRIGIPILYILLFISLTTSLRLSFLGLQNDSRIQAKNWLENNTGESDKVLVYANLMRLPNTKSGITEQEKIDPQSLRTNDKSERDLNLGLRNERIFHALNLYTVKNENFYKNIVNYAKKNGYTYLVISTQDFLNNKEQFSQVQKLTGNAKLLARFGNNESGYSLGKTEIGPTLSPLFQIEGFGPEVEIYKLNQ